MKRIVSKLLVLVLVFNILSIFSAFASDEYSVYNCGELVELEHGVKTYNGNLYICKNDVWQLDLDYDKNYIRKESQSLYLKEGSNVIEWDGRSMMYPQACVKIDDLTYVQLSLIAMVFSRIYDIDGQTINLWIEYRNYSTKLIMGTVSLSSGKVAPQGGIEVEICAVKPTKSELNFFDYNINGYPSYEELSTGLVEDGNYTITASTKITIPEGENCADYYLTTNKTFLENQIFCKVNGEMSCESGVYSFYRYETSYDFYLYEYGHIYGKIIVDKAAEEDANFVVATGRGYNSYLGRKKIVTLPKGETGVSYSIGYYQYNRPQIYIVSDSGKYERKFINSIYSYSDNFEYNVYLNSTESTTVKLSLPNDEVAARDMDIKVYLKSNVNDSTISSQIVTIPEGENDVEIEFANDTSGIYYCEYELLDDYEGYYKTGYCGRNRTTNDKDYAEGFWEHGNLIEFSLIKTKTVSVRVTLPNDEIAQNDIYGWIYERETISQKNIELFSVNSQLETAVSRASASSGSGGGTVSPPVSVTNYVKGPNFVIEQGNSYAEVSLELLCDTDNIIELDIKDDSNRYYCKMYYTEDGGSVLKNNATVPDGDELSFILIKQNKITGFIDDKISKFCTALYAIFQDDENTIKDINEAKFFEKVYIYDENRYSLYVPDELKNYILSLDNEYYYTENSALENKNDAKMMTVNGDVDGVDLIYPENKYSSLLPVNSYLSGGNGEYRVGLLSTNAYPIDCLVKLGLYDNDGRLIDLLESEYECYKNVYYTLSFIISPENLNRATKVKSFVWDKNMITLSNSCEMLVTHSYESVSNTTGKYLDVDDTLSYAEAINVLSALDIAHGYEEEDGRLSFRPYWGVTRAEAVAFIIFALNMTKDAQSASGTTPFDDVNEQCSWVSGYVNVGVATGFIDVPSDGLFHPHENITYSELCKMLVKITGYGDFAESYGYTLMASDLGINKGAIAANDTKLNRGQVYQMIYNALITPMLGVKEYRLEGNVYAKQDGVDLPFKTLLSEKFNAYIAEVQITDIPNAGLGLANNEVSFKLRKDAFLDYSKVKVKTTDAAAIFTGARADIDVSNYLFTEGDAVIVKDNNNWHLVYFKLSENTTASVIAEDYVTVNNGGKSVEADGKVTFGSKNYSINTTIVADTDGIYVNGQYYLPITDDNLEMVLSLAQGCVSFIDTNIEVAGYEVVMATVYDVAKVESVIYKNGVTSIQLKRKLDINNSAVGLSPELTTIRVTDTDVENGNVALGVKHANGDNIDLSDIKKDDVIAFSVAAGTTNTSEIKFIDIIVTDEKISGQITYADSEEKIYAIDWVEYKEVVWGAPILTVGMIYTIELDPFGRIFNAFQATSPKYAIAEKCDSDLEAVQLILSNGSLKWYEIDSIKIYDDENITGVAVSESAQSTRKTITLEQFEDYIENTTAANPELRVIKYTLKYKRVEQIELIGHPDSYFVYKANTGKLGTKIITDMTTIIDVSKYDGNAFDCVTFSPSSFIDKEEYKCSIFTDDSSPNTAAFVVLTEIGKTIDADSRFAVVRKPAVQTQTADGDTCYSINVLYEDEEMDIFFAPDSNATALNPGDVFFFTTDNDGLVNDYLVVLNLDKAETGENPTFTGAFTSLGTTGSILGTNGKEFTFDKTKWDYTTVNEDNKEYQLVYGVLTDVTNKGVEMVQSIEERMIDTTNDAEFFYFDNDYISYRYDINEYLDINKQYKGINIGYSAESEIDQYEVGKGSGIYDLSLVDGNGESCLAYALALIIDGNIVQIYTIVQ